MLHRVLLGSMERFVGGLIEHYAGAFPLWLAPEQVRVLPVTDEVAGVGRVKWTTALRARRHSSAPRYIAADTLNYRIRDGGHAQGAVPRGDRKTRSRRTGTIAVTRSRRRDRSSDPIPVPVDDFIARLRQEIETRSLTLQAGAAAPEVAVPA